MAGLTNQLTVWPSQQQYHHHDIVQPFVSPMPTTDSVHLKIIEQPHVYSVMLLKFY
jgi:hypothetical protein